MNSLVNVIIKETKIKYILFLFLLSCSGNQQKDAKKYTAKEIYDINVNKTVTIITESQLGSGFFVDEDKIITNYHVIEGAAEAKVILNNSEKKYAVLGILSVDRANDIVLLSVECKSNKFFKLADSMPLPGEKIFALGSPVGLSKTISEGIISSIRNTEQKKLIQITAPISHGSSGCPIIDEYGNLVGVAVSGIDGASNIGFCIPTNYVKTVIDFKNDFIIPLQNNKEQNVVNKENSNSKTKFIPNNKKQIGVSNANKTERLYLGNHLFNVESIKTNNPKDEYGMVNISLKNGKYYLKGEHKNSNGDWVRLRGTIKIISNLKFVFTGQLLVHNQTDYEWEKDWKKSHPDSFGPFIMSPDCEFNGTADFESHGNWYYTMDIGGDCVPLLANFGVRIYLGHDKP